MKNYYPPTHKDLNRREFLLRAGIATLAATGMQSSWAQSSDLLVIALVGGAHIHTPGFIELVKTRSDVRVKWVWDHDPARAEKRAKELKAQVVSDLKKIWSDPEIIAVVIYSETTLHHDLVQDRK